MQKILDFILFSVKDKPTQFGTFHLVFLFAMVVCSALIVIFRKRLSSKFVNRTLVVLGIIFIVLEVYKQLVFNWAEHKFQSYSWYIFPMQFCSTPIYLTALCGFLKKGKVREALLAFMATFGLFAGLSVMILPDGVLCWWAGINIQTMILHSSMVVIGVLIFATKQIETSWKVFFKGMIVFACFLLVALALNFAWPLLKIDALFNMFQLSPYYQCDYPVLGDIQKAFPYPVFLLAYLVGFSSIAAFVFAINKLINKLSRSKK